MKISLSNIGKRFGKEWLFRKLECQFNRGDRIGIKGINGSGKSTLLQIIAGISLPTEGKLSYQADDGSEIDLNNLAGKLSIVSPYMDLPEQLTIAELYEFHSHFINYREGTSLESFLATSFLEKNKSSFIHQLSSGMKQRLKLGFAFLSDSPVLLLDEPTSNLDQKGKDLFVKLLDEHSKDRILFIASNEEEDELINCTQVIDIMKLKEGLSASA